MRTESDVTAAEIEAERSRPSRDSGRTADGAIL